jgi:hypothetical protein
MPVSGLCLPWLIEDCGFVLSAVLDPLRCGPGGTLASLPSWAAVKCETVWPIIGSLWSRLKLSAYNRTNVNAVLTSAAPTQWAPAHASSPMSEAGRLAV